MPCRLFTWANQFRAVAATAALALGLVAVPATAIPHSAAMSAPAPAERARLVDEVVAGGRNSDPLLLAFAAGPRPRDWTAFLAGESPRPNHFIAQSAEAPAPDSAAANGDNRLATLGDLKEFRRESREDLRETRAEFREDLRGIHNTLHLIWATMVGGFIALLVMLREKKTATTPRAQPAPNPAPAAQPLQPPAPPAPRPTPRFAGMKPAAAAVLLVAGIAVVGVAAAFAIAQ